MLLRKGGSGKQATPFLYRFIALALFTCLFLGFLFSDQGEPAPTGHFTAQYVQNVPSAGGRAFVPASWLERNDAQLNKDIVRSGSVLEKAEWASKKALEQQAVMAKSRIPLMIHQIWLSNGSAITPHTWPQAIKDGVEGWLDMAIDSQYSTEYSRKPELAWFLWDDDSIDAFLTKYEPELYESYFKQLPLIVEKADLFRIVVLKWLGGIYADMDTSPLKHPHEWIYDSDLTPWRPMHTTAFKLALDDQLQEQEQTSKTATPSLNPIQAIFGIEGDNPPAPDPTYWRKGYTFPVQLTNWAMAMAPHHPVAYQYIEDLKSVISGMEDLRSANPVSLSGPCAITRAVQTIALQDPGIIWDDLSGLHDPIGGRGKTIGPNRDTLILPITGFHPGGTMGSQSITHPTARLQHAALGSWRKMSLTVEVGRLCRVLFGGCRDWSKIGHLE